MVVTDRATKVHRMRDGYLFGWCGSVEHAEVLKRCIKKGDAPPANLDVVALLISPEGEIRMFEGLCWLVQKEPYYAIGSGGGYAMAAMDAGADAATAALIGSKRDSGSGGKIKKVTFR